MKVAMIAALGVLLGAFAAVAQDNKPNDALVEAVKKAIKGDEVKNVKVDGRHNFHIKPIRVQKGEKGVGASGQLSHDISGRPDDQITYRITIKDGKTEVTTNIDRGGLGRMIGVPGKVSDKLGQTFEGKWEAAMLQILDVITVQIGLE